MIFNAELAKMIQNKPMPEKMFMHDFYVAVLCSALGGGIVYDEKSYMKYRQHGNNVIGVAKGTVFHALKRFLVKIELV